MTPNNLTKNWYGIIVIMAVTRHASFGIVVLLGGAAGGIVVLLLLF